MPRFGRRTMAALLLAAARPAPAQAQAPADLQLVLAVDASGSVSMPRFELQRNGYAAAFRDAEVLRAIQSGPGGTIAVTMLQWTGPSLHVVVVEWMAVHDAASAAALAAAIAATPRKLFGGGTSISGAIDFAMTLFPAGGSAAARRIIDVSGDGSNNSGRPAAAARDDAVAAGVEINGLPILTVEPDLDSFYRENVVGGPDSFVIAIDSYENFAAAIRRKLITEISANPPASAAGRTG